jgi:hypothetical protein
VKHIIHIPKYTKIAEIIKKRKCLTAWPKEHDKLPEKHNELNKELPFAKLAMDFKKIASVTPNNVTI